MRKKGWLLLLIILFLAGGAYFGYNWWNRDIVSIKTVVLAKGTIEEIVSASGWVDAPIYDLGTKIGGKISKFKVKEGARVKRGQLLAEFDSYEQARNDFERTQKLFRGGAASRQALDAARTIFEASRIVSPDNGLVAKINYREGETVVPGSTAIQVVNYDQSWIEAQIDEIDIANARIGDLVKITTDVYPNKTFSGRIYWIAPVAELRKVGGRVKLDEESYVFPCKIKFVGPHSELKVNMSVNVDIVTRKKGNVVLIPREALFTKDEATVVFVVRKDRVAQTKIEVGLRSYANVEALAGVSAGDAVAVTNLAKLKERGRITIER